jgi:hypothetical protein
MSLKGYFKRDIFDKRAKNKEKHPKKSVPWQALKTKEITLKHPLLFAQNPCR